MVVEHRYPTPDDISFLAAHMRGMDLDEVRAATHDDLETVIYNAVASSYETSALLMDGKLVSIWGVWPLESLYEKYGKIGIGWLLSTGGIEENPKQWLTECRQVMTELVKRWDAVIGAIDIRHVKSIRWAERLGFVFGKHEVMGVEGRPFVWFRFSEETLNV